MRILSFDTSTNELHLALLEDGRVVDDMIVREADAQTRQEAVSGLMPSIVLLMDKANWRKDTLECIVVGEGPGSFTGIRAGIVTARTVAQALNLPLVAVTLLDCYAALCELPAAIIISAGRGRYFVAGYDSYCNGTFQTSVISTSISKTELEQTLSEFSVWYGDQKTIEELSEYSERLKPIPQLENIASKQAQIAWDRLSLKLSEDSLCSELLGKSQTRFEAGNGAVRNFLLQVFPYSSVTPLYLRSPSVTMKKPASEQAHGN